MLSIYARVLCNAISKQRARVFEQKISVHGSHHRVKKVFGRNDRAYNSFSGLVLMIRAVFQLIGCPFFHSASAAVIMHNT